MLSSGGCSAAKEAPGCRGRGRTRKHLGVPQPSQRQALARGQGTGSGAPLHLSSDSKAHISLKKWGLGIPEVLIPTSDGRSSGRDNSSCRADFLLHHAWAESTEIGAGKAEVVMEPGHPPQADVLQQQERESSGFPPTSCSYEQDIDFLHLLQAQHTDCEHGLHLEPLVP